MQFSCTAKDKYRIKMSDFQDYMVEDRLRDFPDLSYLLTIVEEKKKPDDKILIKELPFTKKRD